MFAINRKTHLNRDSIIGLTKGNELPTGFAMNRKNQHLKRDIITMGLYLMGFAMNRKAHSSQTR